MSATSQGSGRVPRARTLAEAYMYIEVSMPMGDTAIDYDRYATATLRDGLWRIVFDGPYEGRQHHLEVEATDLPDEDDDGELCYGPGTSELIDAAYWIRIEVNYAAGAEAAQRQLPAGPVSDEWYNSIVKAWSTAAAAAREAAKFVPAGATEVPESACWSEETRTARRENLPAFGLERLRSAREWYLAVRNEFARKFR